MRGTFVSSLGFAATLLMGIASASAEPLGAEFTYQGQLSLAGSPLNDSADFEFTLWDADVDGNMVGPVVAVDNVNVVDGRFTVSLDFGVDVFNGEARMLEIEVRSPAGQGEFTTLSSRQPVSATPYALQTRGIFVDDAGNVGIGTTTPRAPLDVEWIRWADESSLKTDQGGAIELGDSTANGTIPYIDFHQGVGEPQDYNARIINDADGRLTLKAPTLRITGNVGIGTTTPGAKLHIAGTPGVDGIMFPDGTVQTSASLGNGGDCPCPFNQPVRAFEVFSVPPGETIQHTAFTAPPDRPIYVTGVTVAHTPNADFAFFRILVGGEVVLEFMFDAYKARNFSWSSGGGAPILADPYQDVVVEVQSLGGPSQTYIRASVTGFVGDP